MLDWLLRDFYCKDSFFKVNHNKGGCVIFYQQKFRCCLAGWRGDAYAVEHRGCVTL
jgi:hypothetical protein